MKEFLIMDFNKEAALIEVEMDDLSKKGWEFLAIIQAIDGTPPKIIWTQEAV